MQDVLIQSWTFSQLKTWKCVFSISFAKKVFKIRTGNKFLSHQNGMKLIWITVCCILVQYYVIQNKSEYLNEISIWWSVQAHWRLYISSRWNFFSSLSLSFHFHLTFIVSVQKLKLAFHLIRTNIVEMISSATQPWFSCTLFGRDRQKLVTIKLIYITHCCVYHTLVTSNNNTVFRMLKLK